MVLRDTTPIKGQAGSERLVVLMHGWCGHFAMFSLGDLEETLRAELQDADLMVPTFSSGVFSNTDLDTVCTDLAEAIDVADANAKKEARPYQEIILIGFSLGSLIVRMTYLVGRGDMRLHNRLMKQYAWAGRVTRILLLAGNNRGWSMDPKPKRLLWRFYLMFRFLAWVRTYGLGKLIFSYRRGQPFVENLRIQWLRREQEEAIPPTIHLYGELEDLVNREDMLDQQYCKNFIFIDVPQTGHADAANFHEPQVGAIRRERFILALRAPIETLREQTRYITREAGQSKHLGNQARIVQHVVFVIHGIRDYGDWTNNVRARIDQIAKEHDLHVVAITPAYKRFPMSGFLLGWERRKKVEWFVNEYTKALAEYPSARFHFIGHSNGTYLLANALERYEMMEFNRVVFAGSVVRRDYPWDELVGTDRVESVSNWRAVDDLVVAIFPRFFELLDEATGISLGDIGGAGVFGFQDNEGQRHQVLLRGGHGAAIAPANHASLVRYVLGIHESPKPDPAMPSAVEVPARTMRLATFSWVVWLMLVASPFLLALGLTYVSYLINAPPDPFTHWLAALPFPWIPVLIPFLAVGVLLWWFLKTW